MPGLLRVGLPLAPEHPAAVGIGVGAGLLDSAQNPEPGSRLGSNAAAAFTLDQHWTVGLDVSAYRDAFGGEVNGYGEPRITGRFVDSVATEHRWGLQLDARLIGREAPSIDVAAVSPTLRGLYGYRASHDVWVGAELGFHLNRTTAAIPKVAALSDNDRRSLNSSSWHGLPWGIGVSYQLVDGTALVAELGGEVLLGAEAPGITSAPGRVGLGVQHWFGASWLATVGAEVAISRRVELARDRIMTEEPRVSGFFGLTWVLEASSVSKPPTTSATALQVAETETPQPEPAKVGVTPQPIAVSPVAGTIVDEGGRPLADVAVVLEQDGQPTRTERTFADGRFEFADVPAGAITLKVAEAGFDDVAVSLAEDAARSSEIVMRPAVPAGQVRGRVLDLSGNPVLARVTVDATGKGAGASPQPASSPRLSSIVAADGSFELDLTPGRYVVRFEHADFAPQRRNIVVKDKGVVILNIALIR